VAHRFIPRRANFTSKMTWDARAAIQIFDEPHLGQGFGLSSTVTSFSTATIFFRTVFLWLTDYLIGSHIHLGPLVIPVSGRINLLEFWEGTRKLPNVR
jgi:hypothetical protein